MSRRQPVVAIIALVLGFSLPAVGQSRRGELRGAWIGAAHDRDRPAIMQSLQDNGFNALFLSFSTGDDLVTAAKAAREHGLELHVSRTNWVLHGARPDLLADLERAGRLQRNHRGQLARDDPEVGVDWLCPSHPDNRRLEKEAMLELVRRYDIAGIQFDYMRLPSGDYCFCDHCKEQFQRGTGAPVVHWPDDVLPAGPLADRWRQWRRDLITSLAEEISDEARRLKPDICVSLAAWPDLDAAREAYAQDWPAWARGGVLDFICPMDYTEDEAELAHLLDRQLKATRGETPLYAGLGAFLIKSSSVLIGQVEAARRAGADGFAAFAYASGDLVKWLPDLHASVAAVDPNPMPHRSPPAHFSFSGQAMASSPGEGEVLAGAALEVEIMLGGGLASPEEQEKTGAAEAQAVLRRMMETRRPIASYEEEGLPAAMGEEEQRLSGRIVVEDPSGRGLLVLGAFDTDARLLRRARFPAPQGPFRIAIYGTEKTGARQQDFVCRSPLLIGAKAEDLQAQAIHAELDRLGKEICDRPEVQQMAHLNATFQLEATGPGGGEWWLRLSDGNCESGEGTVANPDLTFAASAEDLLAIARQDADPFLLWQSGRLKAAGDPNLLRRLAEVFASR